MHLPTLALVTALLTVACTGHQRVDAETVEPPAATRFDVNGLSLHVQQLGSGEPLLLLHGFGGCGQEWHDLAAAFAPSFRLIIPDLRGHGSSTNPSGRFRHDEAATDLLALLDLLAIDRVSAIGISSGGMTLMHMAVRDPDRITAMILVGSANHFPDQARAITRRAASEGPRPGDLAYFRRCARYGEPQIRALAGQFADFAESVDDVDFPASRLGRIRARTLIVHGDRDEFFPVDIPVAMYRAIPDSALWIVPDGSHVPIHGPHAINFRDTAFRFLTSPRQGSD